MMTCVGCKRPLSSWDESITPSAVLLFHANHIEDYRARNNIHIDIETTNIMVMDQQCKNSTFSYFHRTKAFNHWCSPACKAYYRIHSKSCNENNQIKISVNWINFLVINHVYSNIMEASLGDNVCSGRGLVISLTAKITEDNFKKG